MWEYCTLDVAKFTTLISLTLLISCKFSFPIFGLKISSHLTLALKSPNKFSCGTSINDPTHTLVPCESYPLYNF